MASSTGIASCIFQNAEGKACGKHEVYGTGKDSLRFCWDHYVLRCAQCQSRQALFECALILPSGTPCRAPLCSPECYQLHQQKHPGATSIPPKKISIQVIFADGSIYDHTVPETGLTEELLFEHPQTKAPARCLRRPSPTPGGVPVYAELPQTRKPLPPPLEIPKPSPVKPQPGPFSTRNQNAVTAFSLHVSWLTALIETRDERILRVLPSGVIERLEQALVETTVALLEANSHGG
jgi:hypothetical protein